MILPLEVMNAIAVGALKLVMAVTGGFFLSGSSSSAR
jgi:hypothetical protein